MVVLLSYVAAGLCVRVGPVLPVCMPELPMGRLSYTSLHLMYFALMNNAPTAPEGVAPTEGEHANVRLEAALLPRRNQTGAVEYYACVSPRSR